MIKVLFLDVGGSWEHAVKMPVVPQPNDAIVIDGVYKGEVLGVRYEINGKDVTAHVKVGRYGF